jgi:hypothetical protein
VRRKAEIYRRCRIVLAGLLAAGFAIFFFCPDYSMDGIVDQSRAVASERIKVRHDDTLRGKHSASADLALLQSAAGMNIGFSLSLLRFDLKQNLRTWPVLATGIERSPPSV